MVRRVEFEGRVHEFPDDATDAEIAAAIEQSGQSSPATGGRRASVTPEQSREVSRRAVDRMAQRLYTAPFGGPATFDTLSALGDPARRRELMNSARGAWRDAQQIPRLDFGRLAQDTMQAGAEGIANLPRLGAHLVQNLPQLAWEITGAPIVRGEDAQQRLDLARVQGDPEAEAAAARDANAALGHQAANALGFAGGAAVRTPAQAAGFAAALDAPFALSRDSERPLQERLPSALTEMGGVAAFAGTLQGGANMLADVLSAPPRTGRMVERFDRAGVDPSLAAANGGGVSGIVTNTVADNLAAGPLVRGRMRRQLTQARDEAHRIGAEYGRARPIEEAGRVIERGVTRYATERGLPNPQPGMNPRQVSTRNWSFASKADAVFDDALRPVLDNPAPLTHTMRELDALSGRADAPIVRNFHADPTLTEFERIARRLQRGASDTFEAATMDDLGSMASEIATARRVLNGGEQRLSTWVRRQGGIRDDRGDIRGMDPRGVGASSILNRDGRTIDDLAVMAWEDGYFPGAEPPTARQFIDTLGMDLREGRSIYPERAHYDGARQVLQHYERQGVDVSLRGEALRRALRPLIGVDEGTGGRPPTLRDLRELRRRIRMAQDPRATLGQTVDNAALQRIEAALTRDIYEAAGDAAGKLQLADQFYRRGRQRIDAVLSDFARGEPGRAIPEILSMAKPNGNTRNLAALRTALRDDEWRSVVASLIEYMGQPTPGASGFVSELGFSVQRFFTVYGAMTPQARRIIFGSRGGAARGPQGQRMRDLADDLDNLAQVARQLKGVESMQNFSRSGAYIGNMATSAGAVMNFGATFATIVAMGLIGELLSSPAAVRWLTSAPRGGAANAAGYRRWVSQLAKIASRDPALAPVYNELAQSQAREYGRPARESSDRSRSLQRVP